tara:strand:+ start:16305 stop:17639 length:1335 start_codon:yes stop_codon:yes gene_type:complete
MTHRIDGIEHFCFYMFKFNGVVFKLLLSGEDHSIIAGNNCVGDSVNIVDYIVGIQEHYSSLPSNGNNTLDFYNEEKFIRIKDSVIKKIVKKKIVTSTNKSSLVKLIKHYKECHMRDKTICNRKFPNFRYHYTNIRDPILPSRDYKLRVDREHWIHHFEKSRIIMFLSTILKMKIKRPHIHTRIIILLRKHKLYKTPILDLKKNIIKLYEDISHLYTEKLNIDVLHRVGSILIDLYNIFLEDTFRTPLYNIKTSTQISSFRLKLMKNVLMMRKKIKQQFSKIREPIRSKLKENINEVIKSRFKYEIGKNIEKKEKGIKRKILSSNKTLMIYRLLFWTNVRLMDLYTMGRMFSIDNFYKNVIFHGGSFHSSHYDAVLKRMGLRPVIDIRSKKHCIVFDTPFDYVNYSGSSLQELKGGRILSKKRNKCKKTIKSKKKQRLCEKRHEY